MPPPLAVLPDGASPYFSPVQTADKRGLLALLEEQQIDAVDFWSPAHPSLPTVAFPVSAQLRASVVGVPVHQELRSRNLERIAAVLRRWAKGRRTRRPSTRPPLILEFGPVTAQEA